MLQEWENKETTSYITYVVLLLSITFNIFIYCYIGELVAEKVKTSHSRSVLFCWKNLMPNLINIFLFNTSSIFITTTIIILFF